MKTIQKILAGFFLSIGLSFTFLFTIDIINPKTTTEEKENALAALCLFGLPSTAIGVWQVWSLRQQYLQQTKKLNLEKEQLFLSFLQQEEGEITVAKFALFAHLSLEEAQAYLDQKAQQLNANFETNNEGVMIYKFPL